MRRTITRTFAAAVLLGALAPLAAQAEDPEGCAAVAPTAVGRAQCSVTIAEGDCWSFAGAGEWLIRFERPNGTEITTIRSSQSPVAGVLPGPNLPSPVTGTIVVKAQALDPAGFVLFATYEAQCPLP